MTVETLLNDMVELQWGHVLSDVEMGAMRVIPHREKMLQWGHVLSDVEIFFRRLDTPDLIKLQWGHVLSDVEMASRAKALLASLSGPVREHHTIFSRLSLSSFTRHQPNLL